MQEWHICGAAENGPSVVFQASRGAAPGQAAAALGDPRCPDLLLVLLLLPWLGSQNQQSERVFNSYDASLISIPRCPLRSGIIQNFFWSHFCYRSRCCLCCSCSTAWILAVTTLGSTYYLSFYYNLKLLLWLMSSSSYWLHISVRDLCVCVNIDQYFIVQKRKTLFKGATACTYNDLLHRFL